MSPSGPIRYVPSSPIPIVITAQPLTRDAFAPFGDAIYDPRPAMGPWDYSPVLASDREESILPFPVTIANQGTALRYGPVSNVQDLTRQAPSLAASSDASSHGGIPTMSMFVCRRRELEPLSIFSQKEAGSEGIEGIFPVRILERHPFTSQMFVPLSSTPRTKYLVIVAPTLPENGLTKEINLTGATANPNLPVPKAADGSLPGAGMPDLTRLQAFVCEGHQAVNYAAGTWHAPMVMLRNGHNGSSSSSEDNKQDDDSVPLAFLVYQTTTGNPAEDCQEVVFTATAVEATASSNVTVPGALVQVPRFCEKPRL